LIQPATQDGAGLSAGALGTLDITGLTAVEYRIEVVLARTEFGYLNTVRVNGAVADRTFLGTPVNDPWNATTDGLEAGNWLIWDDVAPAGGTITITDTADSTTLGIVNAVRVLVTEVPVELQSFSVE
jgi:hypothetical protein